MRFLFPTSAFCAALLAAPAVGAQAPEQWMLAPRPTVVIGDPERSDELLARVVGLALAPTGEVILWEPNSAGVRIFSRDGATSRVLARSGAGPGEVRDARWIGLAGDTIMIVDGTLRRITRMTAEGRVLSSVNFRPAASVPGSRPVGRLADGTLVWRGVDPAFDGTVEGARRDTVALAVSRGDGTGMEVVTRVPGTSTFTARTPGGGAYIGPLPFGARELVVAGPRHIWVADNASPTVRAISTTGDTAHSWRAPLTPQPLAPATIAAARDRELEQISSEPIRRLVEQRFAAAPSTPPLLSGLSVAPNGDLWLTEYAVDSRRPVRVFVMTESGGHRASLELPSGFRIAAVTEHTIMGVHRDADDVETVRIYSFHRAA
jgi:hypothetical protein